MLWKLMCKVGRQKIEIGMYTYNKMVYEKQMAFKIIF